MGSVALRTCRAVALLFLISQLSSLLPLPAAADDGPYLLRLERGDSIQVLRLEPATFGMFRYVRTDSVEAYLSGHKVRSISDATGRDLGRDPMERRRAIGVDPLLYRREGSPGLFRRHRSRRQDRTFPIFEIGFYRTMNKQSWPEERTMTAIDVGAMRNVAPSVSIGAALHFESDEFRKGLGLSLRGRRWFGDFLSLDGAAGWMLSGDDARGAFKGHSYYGEGSVNLGDHLQVVGRFESWKWAEHDRYLRPVAAGEGTPPLPEGFERVEDELPAGRETLVHLGARIGTYQGILAVAGILLFGSAVLSRN